MHEIALEMIGVSKKFARGERHNSLRDLVPSVAKKMLGNKGDDGIRKNEFWALQDVSFSINKGESLGIIGPNGAGKSTILKILTRIMNPTRGSIWTKGRLSALIEIGAGFHQDLTGRENIFLNGTILGMDRGEIRKKLDQIIEFSGLADFIDTPVKRYSSGMYARLGFSVAAHVEPEIMIVDEVLSVGDYLFQRKCVEKMNAIMKSGVTLIFVSHDLKTVSDICERTLLLEKGRTLKIGPTNEVIQEYLNRNLEVRVGAECRDIRIKKVGIRGERGEEGPFTPGDKLFIDIEVFSAVHLRELSISIYIQDSNGYELFNTSTERLEKTTFSTEPDETWKCTFELTINLTDGRYSIGALIYQYNIEKLYDEWFPARTFFVSSNRDVRGGANLYPQVLTLERQNEKR
jgi:lipopolysaccharide transport system ATP-binding protein